MSAEQGDVEALILSALGITPEELNEGERKRLTEVLDLLAAVLASPESYAGALGKEWMERACIAEAALERAERIVASVQSKTALDVVAEKMAAEDRAEKAERALADLVGAVDAACDFDSLQDQDEMWPAHLRSALEHPLARARAALRPSEDTSDES